MASTTSHKSWDSVRCSTETSDEPERSITMSKEAFDDCQNCLNSLNDCLWHMRQAAFYPRPDDMTAGTFLEDEILQDPRQTQVEKAIRLFKGQLQVFHRIENQLMAELSTLDYHHVSGKDSRSQRPPSPPESPKIESSGDARHSVSVHHDFTFEQPRKVPSPDPRTTVQRHSPPPKSSSTVDKPTLVDPEAFPPVPARNPSRRVSDIHTPTGSVRLFNPPLDFVVNLLPEEHRARAKRRASAQHEQHSDPDLTLRGSMRKTPEGSQPSTTSSANTSFSRILMPIQSTTSLRLSAVKGEQPSLPKREKMSLRLGSRSKRYPPIMTPHAQVPSSSQASNSFYTEEPRGARPAPFHRPAAVRTDPGLFLQSPSGEVTSPQRSKSNITGTLDDHHVAVVREKLAREHARAKHQMEEAERMLRRLPQAEPLQEGWVTPEGVPSAEGLEEEDDSIGKRLKNLWRVGTKRAKTQAVRV